MPGQTQTKAQLSVGSSDSQDAQVVLHHPCQSLSFVLQSASPRIRMLRRTSQKAAEASVPGHREAS